MIAVLMPCLFLCNTSARAELRKQERARKLCSATLRWPNTVFKCLCLIHHYFLTIYALAPIFCMSQCKVNYRRFYSRIFVRMCAVAMATGLVKNKA